MDLQPTDFLSGLGGLANLPDPFRETQETIQAGQQNMAGRQQLALGAAKLNAIQQQQAQAAQYQSDVEAALKNPSPSNFSALLAKYPDQHEALKAAWDAQDEQTKRADLTHLGALFSYLQNGKPDLAAKSLQDRIDAERKAGLDTSDDERVLQLINSGNKDDLEAAKGLAAYHLASVLGPDKYGQTLKDLGVTTTNTEGKVVGKSIGHYEGNRFVVDYTAPDEGQLREIKVTDPTTGEETTQFVRVGAGGGGQASGGGGSVPLSVRANNPGAIRYDPQNKWQGQVGQQDGFVVFNTPENGVRAHRKLIANQINSGYDTPLSWAQHYAPASDGNDPASYAQKIAAGLGIGINDKIPASAVPKMAAISAAVEAGGTPSPAKSGSPGVVASYVTKPAGTGELAPGDTTKTGEEYLATLPASLANQVRMLADGRFPLPANPRSKSLQQLMAAASQYDPDLDYTTAKTRLATRKDFTSGKAAQNITSFNTVLHHIDDLQHVANDLNNGSIPALNAVGNFVGRQAGSAKVAKFNTAKQAVVDELERAFRGSSGTLAGIKGWEDSITANSSPEQIKGVLNQMANLLAGRIDALGEQYTAGMGKPTDGINLLDSKAKQTLQSLADGYQAPQQTNLPAGSKQIGTYQGKPVFQLPNGKRVVAQ